MILCVGASSRRVVEEAARLKVHQIVASRRQVGETSPGYTGYDSVSLVETVRKLSGGETRVVRDHGGPYQNGSKDDDWTAALDADADAGFDGLHLDVCCLPQGEQLTELTRLCRRYAGKVSIEIGGERDSQQWLYRLLEAARSVCQPSAAVAALGGRIWADRQCGALIGLAQAQEIEAAYNGHGLAVKAHNMDWMGERQFYQLSGLYNVAPEFGNVEADAWLHLLSHDDGQRILNFAYGLGAWHRWFDTREGTHLERARAALRYCLDSPYVRRVLDTYDDTYVRAVISDAVANG